MRIKTTEPALAGQEQFFVQMYNAKTAQQRALIQGLGLRYDQDSCPKSQQTHLPPLRHQPSCRAAKISPTPRGRSLCVEEKGNYISYNRNKNLNEGKYIKRKKRLINKIKALVKELKRIPTYDGEPSWENQLSSFSMDNPRNSTPCSFGTWSRKIPNQDKFIGSEFEDIPQSSLPRSARDQTSKKTARSRHLPSLHVIPEEKCAGDFTKSKKKKVRDSLRKLHLITEVDTLLEELARMNMYSEEPNPDNVSGFEGPFCPQESSLEPLPCLVNSRRPGKPRLDPLPCSDATYIARKLWLNPLTCSEKTRRPWKPKLDPLPCSLNKCSSKRPSLESFIGSEDTTTVKSTNKVAFTSCHPTSLPKKRALDFPQIPVNTFSEGPDRENTHFTFKSSLAKEKEMPERSMPATFKTSAPRYLTTTHPPQVESKTMIEPVWSNEKILSLWLHQLKSNEGDDKIRAMNNIRVAAENNPDLLKTKLHDVCLLLTLEVKNQRATIACAAINTLSELHFYLQKAMDPEAGMTCRSLLLKFAQTTDPFLLEQANTALDILIGGCTPARVLPVLINTGLNHLSDAVRLTTASHLHQLAGIVGGEKLLTSGWLIVECLVPAVTKISMDGSREIRRHGQMILQELSHQDHFMELYRRLVPPKERIHLNKILRKLNQNTTRHV